MQIPVELRKLGRGEVWVVRWFVVLVDDVLETAQERLESISPSLVRLEQIVPVFECLPLFHRKLMLLYLLCLRAGLHVWCRGTIFDTIMIRMRPFVHARRRRRACGAV